MNTTLQQYARILRVRWRWVATGVIAAVALTAAVLLLWPPLYRSEATVFVRTPGDVSQSIDGGDTYAQTRAQTYAILARSESVAARVVADTGVQISPQKLAARIQASHIGGTALLKIKVASPSADEARRTAQALITELSAEVQSLEAIPGSLLPRAELVVVDPPSSARRIFAWGAPLYPFLVGPVFLGAFLGALAAVLRSIRPAGFAERLPTITEPSDTTPPSSNASEAL